MKLLSSSIALGAGALLIITLPLLRPKPSELMEQKTHHAQEILRFLAKGNMEQVSKEAKALEQITISAGFEGKSDMYNAYGDEFLNQVRGLRKMADSNNISGTYYYFTRMTGVCFSCHEHVREGGTSD